MDGYNRDTGTKCTEVFEDSCSGKRITSLLPLHCFQDFVLGLFPEMTSAIAGGGGGVVASTNSFPFPYLQNRDAWSIMCIKNCKTFLAHESGLRRSVRRLEY